MNIRFSYCELLIGLAVTMAAVVRADVITPEEQVSFSGDIAYPDELSGIAAVGELLIVTPDEGAELNVFKQSDEGYNLFARPSLLPDADDEIDMEGAAADGDQLYVIGSHSMRRKQVEPEAKYKKNRKRLTRVSPHEASYSLFRVKLDAEGGITASDSVSLADLIAEDEIIGPYAAVAGKEGGIDIEGLAAKGGQLFVGFRGPVLRGNFVPVMVLRFDEPEEYELRFVELGGRGVRDLAAVSDGLLVLAGPVGDGDGSYRLYHWNGEDCVPAEDGPGGEIVALGELPAPSGTKPEGVTVIEEKDSQWRVLVVSDGDVGGAVYNVAKP